MQWIISSPSPACPVSAQMKFISTYMCWRKERSPHTEHLCYSSNHSNSFRQVQLQSVRVWTCERTYLTALQASEACKKHSPTSWPNELIVVLKSLEAATFERLKITSLPDVCWLVCVCVCATHSCNHWNYFTDTSNAQRYLPEWSKEILMNFIN